MNVRIDINGLRGLSFLFIYFYHAYNEIFKCGFFAVDIFILLSGYFSISSKKQDNILTYLTNRIKRIIPVGYYVLFICYIISNILINKSKLEIIYRDLFSSFLGNTNVYFYKKTINYFGDSLDMSINLHYWYFSLQEQYYVLFSLLILNKNKTTKNVILIILFIYSFCYSSIYFKTNLNCVYYLINARLWEFLIGIFVFISNYSIKHNNISNISTFIYIYIIVFIKPKNPYFPFPTNIIILLLGSAILISKSNSFLSTITFQYIGNISFSAYLIHYPILFLCKIVKCYYTISLLILVIIISYFQYTILERNSIIKNANNKEIIISFILLQICVIIFFKIRIKRISYSNIYLTRTKALEDWNKLDVLFISYVKRNYTNIILFMGDSHILQWIPVILKNKNIVYYNLIYYHYWIKYIIYKPHNYLFQTLSDMEIDYIVMSNYLANCSFCIIKQYNDIYHPFKIYIQKLLKHVINRLYIIQDNPYHFKDVFINPDDGISYTYSILGINSSVNFFPIYKNNKLIYINTTKWICKYNKCNLFKDSYSVYIGNHHLTISFTMSLQNEINEEITFKKTRYMSNKSYIVKKLF